MHVYRNTLSVNTFAKSFHFLTGIINSKRKIGGNIKKPSEKYPTIHVENKTPLIDPNAQILTSCIDAPKEYDSIIKFGVSRNGKEFLPYFDAQDVDVYDESYGLSTALCGLELFYYYTEGYGGFIRPRVATISFYHEIMNITQNEESIKDSNFWLLKIMRIIWSVE